MSTGIETALRALTAVAWRDRLSPAVYKLARRLTDREASRQQKMEAIVDHLHREFRVGRPADPIASEAVSSPEVLAMGLASPTLDADDACLFVAALAMSVGIRCRFVGARYGHSWTCWIDYEVGDHWETVDPLRQRPDREPDERVTGSIPNEESP